MLGTYLLTIFDEEMEAVTIFDKEEYLDCLLIKFGVGNTRFFNRKTEHLNLGEWHWTHDLTLRQCSVIGECVRYCAEHLDNTQQWYCQKAVEHFWGRFPPMSEWPEVWSD